MSKPVLRRFGRVVAAIAALLAATSIVALSAGPASAATCRTRAHVYLISLPSQTLYWSGYEGETNLGVPTLVTRRGEQSQWGGNGIKPGTKITVVWVNINTGQRLGIDPQPPNAAGSNCVVPQSPPTYEVTAPPGAYEIRATYTGGNTNVKYQEHLILKASVVP
jgi:hypothetical protein